MRSPLAGSAASRRLYLLFAFTTLLPAIGLAWLGWSLVEQDRVLERQRIQEDRERAADLAAAALQRVLSDVEERVQTVVANPPGWSLPSAASAQAGSPASLPILVLSTGGVLARAGAGLPFYPVPPQAAEPEPPVFAAADEMEFRHANHRGAIAQLQPLLAAADPAVRAGALLRIARNQRKSRNLPAALAAFRSLLALGDTPVGGIPAGLAARQGMALLYEENGDRDALQNQAAELVRELADGRWLLSRTLYEFQRDQACRWTQSEAIPESSERMALAEAAAQAWWSWREEPGRPPAPRTSLFVENRTVLVFSKTTGDQLIVAPVGTEYLESAWLGELRRLGILASTRFALSDSEGRAVLGNPDLPTSRQTVRTASATRLPWTVHAMDRDGEPVRSQRSHLLLAAVILMAVLVVGGSYFAYRAIWRELSVARLQADFVASVSHELRTPITTMRQLSEMLVQGRVSSDERQRQFHAVLLRESDRLHRLVDGLLQFGRMDSGQTPMQFELLDPASLLKEVVAEFEPEAKNAGKRIEMQADDSLPTVHADRETLQRVIWNLLDNAVKYAPKAETVWVELCSAPESVQIRVRDEGPGIPAAEQQHIFEKFVRGVAAREAAIPGTGVGLAMVKQIVEAHGGTLGVESRLGEGTVFTVTLPTKESP
jgi:signal transduction histidine kinase